MKNYGHQMNCFSISVLSPPGVGDNDYIDPPPSTQQQQLRQSSQSKESRLEKDNHELEEYTDSSSIPR
jgi:hypothetical protein